MRKYTLLTLLLIGILSCRESNMRKMANGLQRYIIENDEVKGITTKIEKIDPISYRTLSDTERQKPTDKYIGTLYLKAVWWYEGGLRVYNVADTLECYYDEDMNFLRLSKDISQNSEKQ